MTAVQPNQQHNTEQLLQWVRVLDPIIASNERRIIEMNNQKADMEGEANRLEDRLEAKARRRRKSITRFVNCLYNISEYFYEPEIYRGLSQTIREVQQSYGTYFYIPQSRDLWRESLIHGSQSGPSRSGQQPDLSECNSRLTVNRTEEINELTRRVINLCDFKHQRLIVYGYILLTDRNFTTVIV
uniref:Uncharacterized protein n=1 Tax=Trichobilharzia regenti TaxID=157069 RepID=A0AA85K247_TRIRE|nr:unnamed protein product [Trichobilharzia regenti]